MKINSLRVDEPYRGYLYIKDAAVRTSKNGSQFIKLILSDQDFNEVTGFLWNAQPEDIESYKQGELVGVAGKGKSFNDAIQLDIQRIRLTNDGDNVNIEDFIETAPENPEDMYNELYQTAEAMENPDIRKIVLRSLEERADKLEYFPAAKSVHHAMRGGLLYHTLSMLRLAKSLKNLYPDINEDLLYAGVILHDLGKIDEMQANLNGNVEDYTARGKMLGHITTGISRIEEMSKEMDVDPEIAMLLEHMILSHHYEPEYGSPVKPMFPEAELLHHIDMIDARMNSMGKVQKNLQPGTFSERQIMLDGVRVYRPTFD